MTEDMMESELRVYEVGYILLPSVPEEQISNSVSQIKKLIEKGSGKFISEEDPKLRNLSHEMEKVTSSSRDKFRNGYFGWIKFETESSAIPTLKADIESLAFVLRFLIMKTVREDTYIPKSMYKGGEPEDAVASEVSQDDEVSTDNSDSTDSEELDKNIDELVAE